MRWITAFALIMTAPAAAQAETGFDDSLVPACLKQAGDGAGLAALAQCIFVASDACMQSDAGVTTVGMNDCLRQGTAQWDALLNSQYRALLQETEKKDADLKQLGSAAEPAAPALKQMARNWIAYRDESCRFAALQFQGGSGAGVAANSCTLELTALQALRMMQMTQGDK